MIKLKYEHPPRQLNFYLGAALFFLNTSLPLCLIFWAWGNALSLPHNLAIALLISLLWIVVTGRWTLETWVVFYDRFVPKERDVTHMNLGVPASLAEALEDVADLGFVQLGESQTYAGLSETPITVWLMTSPSNDISFEIFELQTGVENIQFMAQFSSWFEGNRRVETSYPFGDSIESEDYLSEGIVTSVEAAYHFHLREMARFEALYGSPLKVQNLKEFMDFELINRKTHAARRILYPTIRYLILFALINCGLSSVIYMVMGSWFALDDAYILSPFMASLFSLIFSVLGMKFATNVKGRDISKSKKKGAAA